MAGFDFNFPVPPKEREFASKLLLRCQVRARAFQVELTYSWNGLNHLHTFNHYYVQIDGNLVSIQFFARHMLDFCDGFGEGYSAIRANFKRSLTPVAFAGSLHLAVERFQNSIDNLTEVFGGLSGNVEVNSVIFSVPPRSGLRKSMQAASDAFLGYFAHKLTSEQLAEQIHSSSEHLMKALTGAVDLPYAALIAKCRDAQLLSRGGAEALVAVKNLRRKAKHRAENISDPTISKLIQPAIGALQALCRALRHKSAK